MLDIDLWRGSGEEVVQRTVYPAQLTPNLFDKRNPYTIRFSFSTQADS